MRILLVAEEYPPQSGGVGVSCQRLARTLVGQGHAVCVAAPLLGERVAPVSAWGGEAHMTEQSGVDIVRIGPVPGAITTLSAGKVAVALRRFADVLTQQVREFAPDVMHAFYAYKAGFLSAFAARMSGVPLVVSIRGNDLSRDMFLPERLAAFQFTSSHAAAISFVTRRLLEFGVTMFPDMPCPTYVPNAVALPSEVTIPEGVEPKRIAFVGGFREKKGIAQLLTAFAETVVPPQVELHLIGEVSKSWDTESFGKVVEENTKSGHIHITGLLPREKAIAALRTASVAAFPSLDDGMPNGLLEAMALGVPCVASSIFSDFLVHEETALLVDPRNTSGLGQAISLLLSDEDLALRVSRNAKQLISDEHLPQHEAQAFLALYNEVM